MYDVNMSLVKYIVALVTCASNSVKSVLCREVCSRHMYFESVLSKRVFIIKIELTEHSNGNVHLGCQIYNKRRLGVLIACTRMSFDKV